MTVVPFKAKPADSQSEMIVAWHIFCALAQYRFTNPVVNEMPDYVSAVMEAHDTWSALFTE